MAAWIVAFIAIIAAFLVLAVFVLPKLLFVTRYNADTSFDRGVRKETDADGKTDSIVFEPTLETQKYISKYALSDRDGKRVLVCRLAQRIQYIDYDVIVFDGKGKARRVFNVKDAVKENDYTRVVELPSDTEFVSVVVNEADGEKFKHKVIKNASAGRIAAFIGCSAALIAAAVFGIKVCIAYLFAGLFKESFILVARSNIVTAIVCAILIAFDALVTVVAFVIARRRKGGVK